MSGGPAADAAAIRELLDVRAVEQLLVRYFDRVDAGDPDGASLCFAPDVEFEIMIGRRKQGRERFARSLARVLALYQRTSHHLSNITVHLEGDEAVLTGYVYAYHRMLGSGEPWHLWARIHDRLRRTEDGWLIAEHVLHGVDAVPLRADLPADWYTGHPGRGVNHPGPSLGPIVE